MNPKNVVAILLWLCVSAFIPGHVTSLYAQGGAEAAPCVPAAAATPAAPAQQGQRAAAPAQPVSRDASVTAIPGVVAAGATWTKVWQAGGNSADGIVADRDGNALVAQEDFDAVLRIDKNDKTSVYVSNAKGVGSLSID